MARQVASLTGTHRNELTNIELAFLEQRAALLASNKEEMSTLIQERRDMEAKFQEDMMAKKEEFARCLEDIRDADGEEYNNLKVRLESDMQTLEQHHATMQAVYQFNAEKLEYNHLVLVERDRENYITANQQKRKLNKQRDTLVLLKGRYNDLERRFNEQNSSMGHGFAHVTKLLQDLQNKEHGLLVSHGVTRRNFFLMHQRNLSILVSKILQADKDIHENQLGWHWMAPSDQIFIDLASDEVLDDKKKAEPEVANDLAATMSDEKYSSLLGTLCDEAFFLVDEKTREELPTLVPNHQDWVQCVSILQALGIKNGASLEKLRIVLRGQESELKDNDIDKCLSVYLHDEAERIANQVAAAEVVEYDPKAPPGTRLDTEGIKKLKWENYWKSFTTVINSKTLRVWGHLEQGLIAYNKLLKDRVYVTSEVISLRQQNQALREALHHCLKKGKK
ncbi:hypothetical protein M758_3G179200 [Ceratodon purpureus]|nr:hypothetical protein M758_3G179200 [Ceratodon purpureus]